MAKDNTTYGFNKPDAEELLQVIGGADETYIEGKIRGGGSQGSSAVFVTPVGGIAARSGSALGSAVCTRYTVTGGTRASASETQTVYNDFTTAINASTDVIATRINGIWVVVAEDCP